mgnify:CR=1 FL=1
MNLTVIREKIDNIAYSLFKEFLNKAEKHYPDLDFTIKDEKIIVNDLEETIISALKSLYEEKHDIKRLIPLWEVGFILGFIQGNLNSHWFNEYIRKRSEDFKSIVALNAIKRFLDYDEIKLIEIAYLYKELYKSDINLLNSDTSIPNFEIDIKNFNYSNTNDYLDEIDTIKTCVEKIRIKKIFEYAKTDSPMYLPNLDKYFTTEQIQKIIKANDTNKI